MNKIHSSSDLFFLVCTTVYESLIPLQRQNMASSSPSSSMNRESVTSLEKLPLTERQVTLSMDQKPSVIYKRILFRMIWQVMNA